MDGLGSIVQNNGDFLNMLVKGSRGWNRSKGDPKKDQKKCSCLSLKGHIGVVGVSEERVEGNTLKW